MHKKNFIRACIFVALLIIIPPLLLIYFQYGSKAAPVPANIVVDVKKTAGALPTNWKALSQGGEENGVQMLQNVVPQISKLSPYYIRIDHIYDFYNVVSRAPNGNLNLNWTNLDATVCDIYNTGAQPFFSLGYMPQAMSADGSLISQPTNWNEWSYLVQKTIERYSGNNTVLCNGKISGQRLLDIHYEVWNEPDLETFGKWSIYGGSKSYLDLYNYSVLGASRAQNVSRFLIGGPATTAAYQNWFQVFLDYVSKNNLRIDFLSWHHYTKNVDEYSQDVTNIDSWLSDPKYAQYRTLPRLLTEWGYDSQPNAIVETHVGAAHTVAAIKRLVDQHIDFAFAFEIKDGPVPRWGLLTQDGKEKLRYDALELLNHLDRNRLEVIGEGTYVQGLASIGPQKITLILVNYDPQDNNIENVPITFQNMNPGEYTLTNTTILDTKSTSQSTITISSSSYIKTILMPSDSVVMLEFQKLSNTITQ